MFRQIIIIVLQTYDNENNNLLTHVIFNLDSFEHPTRANTIIFFGHRSGMQTF